MTPPHIFTHDAMNTTFSLHFPDATGLTAPDMARECFDLLDVLESKLSRYAEGSDISRVNHLRAGETLYLHGATHRCLLAALQAHEMSGGLFDITLGSHIEHRKSGSSGNFPPLAGSLTIHPDAPAVTCNAVGRVVDLGGIGKGFALDELRELLLGWGATGALLAAGASSHLAFGSEPWAVELAGDGKALGISLANRSLSASGTGIQGSHIIHPGGEKNSASAGSLRRLWVTAPTATLAEIWSTALFLLEPGMIRAFTADEESIGEIFIDQGAGPEPLP